MIERRAERSRAQTKFGVVGPVYTAVPAVLHIVATEHHKLTKPMNLALEQCDESLANHSCHQRQSGRRSSSHAFADADIAFSSLPPAVSGLETNEIPFPLSLFPHPDSGLISEPWKSGRPPSWPAACPPTKSVTWIGKQTESVNSPETRSPVLSVTLAPQRRLLRSEAHAQPTSPSTHGQFSRRQVRDL